MPRRVILTLHITYAMRNNEPMRLETYLEQQNLKQADFAKKVGVTPATVSRLLAGQLSPSLELAARIEDVTKRKVPMRSWVAAR